MTAPETKPYATTAPPAGADDRVAERLAGDVRFQLDFVAGAAWRLVALQDRDPNSPAFGCFHTAYWRDKTSEFPDARFQEAGAALGLLALPVFDRVREAAGAPDRETLIAAFLAGAANLGRQQYAEGSYDEWYKGERGFAATAFTTVAYGFAALHLGDRIADAGRTALLTTLRRAADWLTGRDDVVKVNHEIVATAALAVVWKLTGETRYREAAKRKLAISLAHRDPEGWFVELAGCDLGYSHLVLDYLGLYHLLDEAPEIAAAADGLLRFLVPHLHPDITVAAEAGTCRNPYVGQIGFLVFAERDETAAAIAATLAGQAGNRRRIAAYLADDLRLARWSLLPVLAGLIAAKHPVKAPSASLDALYPQGWTIHPRACLAAFHRDHLHLHAPAAGGAMVRLFLGARMVVEDPGPDIHLGSEVFSTRVYDAGRVIDAAGDGISVAFAFGKARYFYPTFVQRLVLRLGSVTGPTSRFTRAMIDRYRTRKNTAINQSATSVGAADKRWSLARAVVVETDTVRIVDTLRDRTGGLSSDMLRAGFTADGRRIDPVEAPFAGAAEVRIEKRIRLDGGTAMIETKLTHS